MSEKEVWYNSTEILKRERRRRKNKGQRKTEKERNMDLERYLSD